MPSDKKTDRLTDPNKEMYEIFDSLPVSIWVEDFSGVKQLIDRLKQDKTLDLRKYLKRNPEEVLAMARAVKVIWVNSATLKLYQAGTEGELRRGLAAIFDKNSYVVFQEQLLALAEGKTSFSSEGINLTLRGEMLKVLIQLNVLPGCEKDLSKVVVCITDITSCKRSEEQLKRSLEKYRTIVMSAPVPILTLDVKGGIILDANRSAVQFLGFSEEDLAGMHIAEMCSPDQAESCREMLKRALARHQPVSCNLNIRDSNGRLVPVQMRATSAVSAGSVLLWVDFVPAPEHKEPEETPLISKKMMRKGMARENLTRREHEIVRLIVDGLTNKAIAEQLGISVKTIESHRIRIMLKLNVHKATDLVKWALTSGFLD